MNNICKQLYSNFPSKISLACHSAKRDILEINSFKEKTSREQEYILGRYCAQQALKAMNFNCNVIQSSPHGFPIWPNSIVGSISHSKGLCISAVAKSSDFQAIGIDLEQFYRIKERSIERIVHSKEKAQIGNDLIKATLLFSIKEAFYKAQYPIFKTNLNFKDLAFEYDFTDRKAQLVWLSDKSPIVKSEYSNWAITFETIENNCFTLCSKSNKSEN